MSPLLWVYPIHGICVCTNNLGSRECTRNCDLTEFVRVRRTERIFVIGGTVHSGYLSLARLLIQIWSCIEWVALFLQLELYSNRLTNLESVVVSIWRWGGYSRKMARGFGQSGEGTEGKPHHSALYRSCFRSLDTHNHIILHIYNVFTLVSRLYGGNI
jgi:hypothetical protein